ncbi:acyl dehydratase [Isoptericola jiangsuensis]|uniref:Acyl dehydratase n=1 Tax=Isoptericola jiangsuensis TaxID=548579 RepID=A0A2A9ESD8_9MICO|nr:MaoC family dehydratase [Isoptericola jiangsuensis]PFG42057.1 acyl dehydratase [Isoptericola jiangsuensis]
MSTVGGSDDAGTGPVEEVVQRGLWYDELREGVRYVHRPGRTITEADDTLFTAVTMNPQALHLDHAWAATQPFGRPLVNSMLTLATLVGLSVAHLTRDTIVANLGFTDVRFPAPVFHGDTLYGATTVEALRPSASRPGTGVVTLEHVGTNQDGVVVAVARRSVLVWTRAGYEARSREQEP